MKKSENKNSFDDQMQNAFEDFKMDAPKSVWIKIEKELDRRDGIKVKPLLNYRILSLAASFVLLFGLGGLFYVQIEEWGYYDFNRGEMAAETTNKKEIVPESIINQGNTIDIKKEKPITEIHTEKQELSNTAVVEIKAVKEIKSFKKNVFEKSTPEIQNFNEGLKEMSLEENIDIKNNDNQIEAHTDMPLEASNKKILNTNEKNISSLATRKNISSSANKTNKKEINNVIDALNFVAGKISSSDKKVVEIQKPLANENIDSKNYKIDLGFFKFSRKTN